MYCLMMAWNTDFWEKRQDFDDFYKGVPTQLSVMGLCVGDIDEITYGKCRTRTLSR